MILTFNTYAKIVTELTSRFLLIVTHSQSTTRKAVCSAANSKGNARLNENYFLVGLSFTSRFPSQTTMDEICWMPFVVFIFSPPSPSVQVRIFYQWPKELKYHTIGNNFSLIKSRSAQAEGPTHPPTVDQQATCRQKKPDKTNSNLHKSICTFSRPKKVKLLW